ncbi:MAG: hypothetical protein D6806_11360 [Deltaproteobacteria bacterium]|nr:MAG: hypothetical protein D6806_11360 [Deltaproteobacteria bacterium]
MLCGKTVTKAWGTKMNLNHVPWMSVLGIVGLGIGWFIAGGDISQQNMGPPLYGFVIGAALGVFVRMEVRRRTLAARKRRYRQEDS